MIRRLVAALFVCACALVAADRADAFGVGVTGCSPWQWWEGHVAVTFYNPGGVTYSTGFLLVTTDGVGHWEYPTSITQISAGGYRVLVRKPYLGSPTVNAAYGPGSTAEALCTA